MLRRLCLLILASAAAGCTGMQSALEPAGRDAERIAGLFTWMTAAALVIWVAVVALTYYASRLRIGTHSERGANALILGGGVIFPLVVLSVLLVYGLAPLPEILRLPPPGGWVVDVTGHQWWWRVRYRHPDGSSFELANEIRLPLGRRVELRLDSADVVHSFWVPPLAGKMDMVPGRVTRIALEPIRTGTFRGACAEYCGTSHALMSLFVEVMDEDAFAAWADRQRQDAARPTGDLQAGGRDVFLASGCGACHTVRGTAATGRLGPDLTHVGSRLSLGAGLLANTPGNLQRWIVATDHVKPDVRMPAFNMLDATDLVPLAAYLTDLR